MSEKPCWDITEKQNRVSVCLSLVPDSGIGINQLEREVRQVCWVERALEWHDAKSSQGLGCGFVSSDMYTEFSDSAQKHLPPPMSLNGSPPEPLSSMSSLEICCSLCSPVHEARRMVAELLLELLRLHFLSMTDAPLKSIQVLLVSQAARIPLMSLPDGLATLNVPTSTFAEGSGLDRAVALLQEAGMFTVLDSMNHEDLLALRELVAEHVHDAEEALQQEGKEIGSGDISYAEICSRGRLRWDLLLHAGGERQGLGDVNGDQKFDVLERIATDSVWVPVMRAALGEYKWQASVVCSRPGAPAGKWHTDGGHSRHIYDGESGPAYAICVFIPLVQLEAPLETMDCSVKHGFGCTAFWPGSHRYRECAHLGEAASVSLQAVVPGAPMEAGGALIYDYRVVHCASPNDAFELENGERPILQLTYSFHKYNDVGRNYGYYQLFSD